MWWPYHVVDRLNLLMPSASVIKLLSNPQFPINALACGSGINRNSWVANQLNNLASGINYYLLGHTAISTSSSVYSSSITLYMTSNTVLHDTLNYFSVYFITMV